MRSMGCLMVLMVVGCASVPVAPPDEIVEAPREAPTSKEAVEVPDAGPEWVDVEALSLPEPHQGYETVVNEIFFEVEGDRLGSWQVDLVSIGSSPRVLIRRQHADNLYGERDEARGRWRFTPVSAEGVLVLVGGEPRIVEPTPYGRTAVVWGLSEGRWVELDRKTFASQIRVQRLPGGFGILEMESEPEKWTLWTKVDGDWRADLVDLKVQKHLGALPGWSYAVGLDKARKTLALWGAPGSGLVDKPIPAPEMFPERPVNKIKGGPWEEIYASISMALMLKRDKPALITRHQWRQHSPFDCVEYSRPGPPGGPAYVQEICNDKITDRTRYELAIPSQKGFERIVLTGLLSLPEQSVGFFYRTDNSKPSTRPTHRLPMAFASDNEGGVHTVLLDGASQAEGTRLRYVHITPRP